MKILLKREKKWTLKIQKSKIIILVLNPSPIRAVLSIVRFPGDPKTALTGESLYYISTNSFNIFGAHQLQKINISLTRTSSQALN